MRTLAVLLGLLGVAGLVVLAVAGVTGATAILVTGAAVLAMIGLGSVVGGRRTPARPPYGAGSPASAGDGDAEGAEASPGEAGPEGTLGR